MFLIFVTKSVWKNYKMYVYALSKSAKDLNFMLIIHSKIAEHQLEIMQHKF